MSRLDGAEEVAQAAKQFAFLENTLLKNRTLTIFGEIDQLNQQRNAAPSGCWRWGASSLARATIRSRSSSDRPADTSSPATRSST